MSTSSFCFDPSQLIARLSSEVYKLAEPQPNTPGGPWYQLSDYWHQVLTRLEAHDRDTGKRRNAKGIWKDQRFYPVIVRGDEQKQVLWAKHPGQEDLLVSTVTSVQRLTDSSSKAVQKSERVPLNLVRAL